MDEQTLKHIGNMDEAALRQWGALHQRHVSGELMSAEEWTAYQAGCDELDATEKIDGDIAPMRKIRALIVEAEAEQRILRREEETLLAQIAEAEARLSPRSRQLLGIEN